MKITYDVSQREKKTRDERAAIDADERLRREEVSPLKHTHPCTVTQLVRILWRRKHVTSAIDADERHFREEVCK